ncbi:MAG: hypothetical protein KC457_35510, partial [Myxococcales bacterium]|nr:hypothetical protein [Myxococcales bacterium]
LEQARAAIEGTDLVDGRCWMLADGREFLGFEQLAGERILTRVGPKTGHVHANNCFDPSLRQREAVPRSKASFRRMELASTLYVQQRPDTAAAMLDFFDAVEEAAFPGSASGSGSFATVGLAVELRSGRALLRRGSGTTPTITRFFTPFADP